MHASILDSRASFDLAVMVVTWAAVLLLGLIAANLHARLQRLERSEWAPAGAAPYHRWLGQHWRDVLGDVGLGEAPRFVLFLSSSCPVCTRVMGELELDTWRPATVVVWTDRSPVGLAGSSGSGVVLELGSETALRLGVRVAPFALVIGPDGHVARAAPFNDLRALAGGLDGRPVPWPSTAEHTHLREVSP